MNDLLSSCCQLIDVHILLSPHPFAGLLPGECTPVPDCLLSSRDTLKYAHPLLLKFEARNIHKISRGSTMFRYKNRIAMFLEIRDKASRLTI